MRLQTIITSKALLEKINCPYVEGMIYLEDIMVGLTGLHKITAALISKLPVSWIKKLVHGGEAKTPLSSSLPAAAKKIPRRSN